MDEVIANWILEFLLRKRIDDRIVNGFLSALPLSKDNNRLKKTLLLRKIESEASNGAITEKLLDLLETVEEFDHREGKTASDCMKEAYCAVAVDCTVRFLEEVVEKNDKYLEAVKRVWKNRVCKMEGLISEESKRWFGEIEGAVCDSGVCGKIMEKNTRNEALKAVRIYLNEAWESMGPTFLELAAQEIGNNLEDLRAAASGGVGDGKLVVTDDGNGGVKETPKRQAPRKRKQVARKSRRNRGARISDPCEDNEPMNNANGLPSPERDIMKAANYLPTPEVNKVKEALKSSSMELHAAVKDPLPNALRTAQNLISQRETDNESTKTVIKDQTGPEIHEPRKPTENDPENVNKKDKPTEDSRHSTGQDPTKRDNIPKHSLMEPNGTSHTFEWDDSIDNSTGGSPSRPRLPSPKRRKLSPLIKQEDIRFVKRRARKFWTPLEEDTLRAGVQKFGKGNWKLILQCYREIFQQRTEVDLKDKWRNMTRHP